jgi:outer membrane protein assembly factor BamB
MEIAKCKVQIERRKLPPFILHLAFCTLQFAIAFLLLSPAFAAPPADSDWPAFHGGGALTGRAARIPPPPMRLRWTLKPESGANGPSAVGSAAIAADSVYIADAAGTLIATDLKTGTKRWSYPTKDGFETTPLVRGDRVFLGDLGGVFHAVSASDGKPIWTYEAGSPIHSSANSIDDSHLVFGDDGGDIYCLNTGDGKLAWQQHAGDRVNSAPGLSGDTILIGGCDTKLRGLAAADGAERFVADAKSVCPGSPAVADGKIVLGTDGGHLLCFDAATHQQLWSFDAFGGKKAMVYASPAISDGVVVVGARDRSVRGIELASGKEIWNFPTRGDVDSSPAISDGRVYVGSKDKHFYVLDLKTGKELWSFNAGRGITASPAIGRGVVVVGDEGGNVYCFEPAG